jgi:hypothetical protein
MNAGGGALGASGSTSTTAGVQTAGGVGGTAANGDLNIPGKGGNHGVMYSGTRGVGGDGGDAVFGHGGDGTNNGAGLSGDVYGGGGGGGHAATAANRDGGAGANGVLYLIEFIGG